jgi:hypothetical protein
MVKTEALPDDGVITNWLCGMKLDDAVNNPMFSNVKAFAERVTGALNVTVSDVIIDRWLGLLNPAPLLSVTELSVTPAAAALIVKLAPTNVME